MFSIIAPLVSMAMLTADITDHSEVEVCGKVYVTDFDPRKVPSTPKWNEEEDENPPLSARKAVKLTQKVRDSVVDIPNDFEWETLSVSLIRTPAWASATGTEGGDSQWAWSVLYRAVPKGAAFSEPNMLTMFVFMDGTVIKPAFRRKADNESAK
ncbi:MAG TPA: hypothetical protein VG826_23800 [Pirellulales bacterium]|nr:hypothetical protein [Pirellulales bacterium]